MKVSVCVGNYSAVPYYVRGAEVFVYCAEELCYCLKENAFLLDGTLMDDRLADWLKRCCGLPELSGELYTMIHKKGALSAFVGKIMEYVGLYDETVILELQQVLKQGAGCSNIEKRKKQLDYLVEKKRYAAALRGYDELLAMWQEASEQLGSVLKAELMNNKGAAYAGLHLYGKAAEAFWQAWRLDEREEYLLRLLAAKRMELSESEYVDFAAGIPDSRDTVLKLEGIMEHLKEQYGEHPDLRRIQLRREWRENDKQKYYDENERVLAALKNGYRNSVME